MEFEDPYNAETRSKCKIKAIYEKLDTQTHISSSQKHSYQIKWQQLRRILKGYQTRHYFIMLKTCFIMNNFFYLGSYYFRHFSFQSSEDLDTDTEFEPVEDMTLETRSRCNFFLHNLIFFLSLALNTLLDKFPKFSSQNYCELLLHFIRH